MVKTNANTAGVMGVTSLARNLNTQIGSYQEHFLNENFGYSVRLTNGAIRMSREIAEDFETMQSSVTDERVQRVAETYRKL